MSSIHNDLVSITHHFNKKHMINWEKIKTKILNKIKRVNEPGKRELVFLGFVKKDSTNTNNTIIKLVNTVYNEEGEITYRAFKKSSYGWTSPSDRKRVYSNVRVSSKEEILKRIDDKIKEIRTNEGRIIEFLGFENDSIGNSMSKTRVMLYDKTYEDSAVIRCDTFVRKGWTCNKLRYLKSANSNVKITKEIAEKNIREHLTEMNSTYGTELEFLGFVNNKWITANKTKLVLKCKKHNVLCNPTYSKFMGKTLYHCPSCRSSVGELDCCNIVKSILGKKVKIEEQYKINYNNEYIDCGLNYFLVDIFIPSLKIAIEFDGDQHYRYISLFHHTYQNYIDRVNRDICLEQYCQDNSIKLFKIPYCDRGRLNEVIKTFLLEGKDITTHIQPKLLPVPMSYYGQNIIN